MMKHTAAGAAMVALLSSGAARAKPYADGPLEEFLRANSVSVVKPLQYMDKWRLDRQGVRPIPNPGVKKALGFN